ncbi:MAG TPA: thioredoxin domain-containing protein [Bacillota bacterium]|nr:thioredoxin domain-containing protein [Bacillota bacterium]
MSTHENKLIHEKSPYLLQHAHNPVNWYPWGDEAFEIAQKENKPIFLSIGYSTCHWCHVMARESFEDADVASFLNDHYVSIKVDREERPDIDSVYMKVCQMMTGHGGWPLTVVMTPDKIPFYAGTYFPRESKYGMPGIMDVIVQLHEKFHQDAAEIKKVTKSVKDALERTVEKKSSKRLTKAATDEAFEQLERRFDAENGGFGDAPKFPQPQNILFLLRYYHFTGHERALDMAENTLKALASGGIFDHIGFGFARYSTDEKWLVPHFEKMLYDNALLLYAYTECYQVTKNPLYKEISEQIITFIRREMMHRETGAFYSAIDADSEGIEGKYYVWDIDEVSNVLGEELGDLYKRAYHITTEGNFEGKNIPNLIDTELREFGEAYGLSLDELSEKLESARQQLLKERENRPYPHVDDKILTSWNGMMIAALAQAGKVFNSDAYTEMAEQAIQFIECNLFSDGRLMTRFREGEAKYKGYVDDYANMLWAYVELYHATYNNTFLKKGKSLADDMLTLFWDEAEGGFYLNGNDSEAMIAREKEIYDGAIPSGNGIASVMLTQLGYLTGETSYLDKVEAMYYAFFNALDRQASVSVYFLMSLLVTENHTKEVVVLGANQDTTTKSFIDAIREAYLPGVVMLVAENPEDLSEAAPFAASYKKLQNDTTIYICEDFACQKPTTDIKHALRMITRSPNRE